jgi:hypothetical protein
MDKEQAGKDPAVASLFAGLTDVFDHPDRYNLYRVTDAFQVDNIKQQLKQESTLASTLLDLGIAVEAGLAMAVSRNPRVIAALGRSSAYTAGLTTAVGGGLIGRHYGYKALTGIDESWIDSGIHVGASLAAAEVGSISLGRNSLLVGTGAIGPRAVAQSYTVELGSLKAPAVGTVPGLTSMKAALGITTTYNSTATAWDIYRNKIDSQTGQSYTARRVDEGSHRLQASPWQCPPFPASCPFRLSMTITSLTPH